jgi:hypothetical protein
MFRGGQSIIWVGCCQRPAVANGNALKTRVLPSIVPAAEPHGLTTSTLGSIGESA